MKSAGLLRGFGSIDFAKVPSKNRDRDVSAEELLSLSGVQKQNLAPGRPTGSWLSAVRRGDVLYPLRVGLFFDGRQSECMEGWRVPSRQRLHADVSVPAGLCPVEQGFH